MLMKLRRSAAIVLFTVLVTASVTACSDDDSDQAEGTSSSNASYPLTVSTALGDVEIPAEPEDIVTLGDPAFENLAALDVEPTAALVQEKMLAEEYMAEYRDADYMDDRLGVTGREIDIERVASYEPDLIIAPAWRGYADEKVRGQLEEIAPVLLIDEQSSGADWQTGFTQVAEAVNRTEEAEQKLDEIDELYAAAREKLGDLEGASYSFGAAMQVGEGISLAASARGVLHDLGFVAADGIQSEIEESFDAGDTANTTRSVSPENYGDITGDIVFVNAFSPEAREAVEADNLYSSVLADRVVWFEEGNPINNGGALSREWLPDALTETILDSEAYDNLA